MTKCIWTYLIPRERSHYYSAYRIGLQSMLEYSIRIGATLFVHTNPLYPNIASYYERFAVAKQVENFDRVLLLGGDIVIKPDAPDIFKEFPEGIFALNETDSHKSTPHSQSFLQTTFNIYNVPKKATAEMPMWNSCVVLCNGSDLKNLYDFRWNPNDPWHDLSPYNANIYQKDINVKNIGIKWNCFMSRQDAIPYISQSHFLHFDGCTKDFLASYSSYQEAVVKCPHLIKKTKETFSEIPHLLN